MGLYRGLHWDYTGKLLFWKLRVSGLGFRFSGLGLGLGGCAFGVRVCDWYLGLIMLPSALLLRPQMAAAKAIDLNQLRHVGRGRAAGVGSRPVGVRGLSFSYTLNPKP